MRLRLTLLPPRLIASVAVALVLLFAGLGWWIGSGSGAEQPRTASPVQWELDDGKVAWAVVLPRSSLTQVPRAPVFERLPVAVMLPVLLVSIGPQALVSKLGGDRSETLRRVQTRRRVPRMNTDEPPWS